MGKSKTTSTSKTTTAKSTTTAKKTTTAKSTTTSSNNLSTQEIDTWASTLTANLRKFKNSLDTTEDTLQKMASTVKSSTDETLHQAIVDLRALTEVGHRQLGSFYSSLYSNLSKYTKSLGVTHEALSDKLKKQDQFRENANKIAKLSIN